MSPIATVAKIKKKEEKMKRKKRGRPALPPNKKRQLFAVTLPADLIKKLEKFDEKSKLIEQLLRQYFQ